jgi:hypothetical protein
MKIIAINRLEMTDFILGRSRWLIAPLLTAFLAYILLGLTLIYVKNTSEHVNLWDALFLLLWGRPTLIILSPLLCYLVADLAPEAAFGQNLMLRSGSRKTWWQGKTLFVLTAVVVFMLLTLFTYIAIALFVLPHENNWSSYFTQPQIVHNMTADIFSLSPYLAAGFSLVTIGMWWLFLGLMVVVVSEGTRNPALGFLSGLLLCFSDLIPWIEELPQPIGQIVNHLWFVNYMNLPSGMTLYEGFGPALALSSMIYWFAAIGLLYLVGLRLHMKQDFFGKE